MSGGEKKKFLLRIDGDLFIALEKWAAQDLRSVNAQIEYLLSQTVRRAGRINSDAKEEQSESPPEE